MKPSQPGELAAPVNERDHVFGAEHAPVIVIEYGDFECPTCKQAAAVRHLLSHRAPGRVQFVFRHFPIEEFHPHALLAAEAAECAGAQGKFWEMHDLLFENQLHLKVKQLHGYAKRLELDMNRYDAEMEDHVYVQRVREHIESGERSHVRSTPAFFVNGRLRDVSFGLESLLLAVDAALAGGEDARP